MQLHCVACDASYARDPMLYACPAKGCDSPLEVLYGPDELAKATSFEGRGVWRYRAELSVTPAEATSAACNRRPWPPRMR